MRSGRCIGRHLGARIEESFQPYGTVTLFAALNCLDGKLISRTEKKHAHVEWLRFLKQIDRETPKELEIHLIADDCCTRKHKKVEAWLERRPRFRRHSAPTGNSWMNPVERFFADLTNDAVSAGSFRSRGAGRSDQACLAESNKAPKRYRWHASGEAILAKTDRPALEWARNRR